ncbi:unnamed protein product [Adineta ricciae]|uniref:G-protein coupled receptors family 1 profile domain-containing protein n=1 Tax=Adineta ricciae TaxID=249248 RepID=A0A816AU67_ADIRI|nr:unnamed protein product [Adineta ricciae]
MLSNNAISFTKSIIDDFNVAQQNFITKLSLIIPILGLIGFIGNVFTFLQPTLRKQSFCLYTLVASFVDILNLFVNLFPQYFNPSSGNLFSNISDIFTYLLIMCLIDRFACTCGLKSRMQRTLQLKMVPMMIFFTIIVSCIVSLYSPLSYDILPGYGCGTAHPTENAVSYIVIHGIITPVTMLIFVFLTYRKFSQSRQRVSVVTIGKRNRFRNHFIAMVFAQVFASSFFILQWIGMYSYFLATKNDNKTVEEWTVIYFLLVLTNNLYYMINVRSFYLSTLTSRLFRETMIKGIWNLLPNDLYRRIYQRNVAIINTMGRRPTE